MFIVTRFEGKKVALFFRNTILYTSCPEKFLSEDGDEPQVL